MTNTKLLDIYLTDHLAGAIAGYELAKRCESSNRGTPLGNFLEALISELNQDRSALLDIMDRVGASPNAIKGIAAWGAEKIGRLKMNGRLTGYSDLSRLLELEGLSLGVEGKLSGWKALKEVGSRDQRLANVDFDELIQRASRQRAELEERRLDAVRTAFAPAGVA